MFTERVTLIQNVGIKDDFGETMEVLKPIVTVGASIKDVSHTLQREGSKLNVTQALLFTVPSTPLTGKLKVGDLVFYGNRHFTVISINSPAAQLTTIRAEI